MTIGNAGYRALLRESAHDRDELMRGYLEKVDGNTSDKATWPLPAEVIDEIIREVACCRLGPYHLPPDRLGETDFGQEVPEIRINEDYREVPGYANANPVGLENVIKAHELGHVRRGHGRQLGAREATLLQMPMFEGPRPVTVCPRRGSDAEASLSKAEKRREFEAWVYAEAFLVLGWPLSRSSQYQWLRECAAQGREPAPTGVSGAVYAIAEDLMVTPTFARTALRHLGVIRVEGEVVRLNAEFDLGS